MLAGIAALFFFQALQSLVQFLTSPEVLQQIVFWLSGSLPKASWTSVQVSSASLAMRLGCVLPGRHQGPGWRVAPADLAACNAALARLGPASLADRPPDSLSGGQQQMVLLAQRLVHEPRLMVPDKPTSALDLHHQSTILDQVRS